MDDKTSPKKKYTWMISNDKSKPEPINSNSEHFISPARKTFEVIPKDEMDSPSSSQTSTSPRKRSSWIISEKSKKFETESQSPMRKPSTSSIASSQSFKSSQYQSQSPIRKPSTSSLPQTPKTPSRAESIAFSFQSTRSPGPPPPPRSLRVEKSLWMVKGKRKIYVTIVECHSSSIFSGDVFILELPIQAQLVTHKDPKTFIFVWMGPDSGKIKRAKAQEFAIRLADRDWNHKAEIFMIGIYIFYFYFYILEFHH